jgi:GxxExxY protein
METMAVAGIQFRRQVPVPLIYKGTPIDRGFRLDLLIEGDLIVEIKSTETVHPVCIAQIITYLKLTGASQCLLLNFKVRRMTDGVRSFLRPRE